jgi:hypothetical protein
MVWSLGVHVATEVKKICLTINLYLFMILIAKCIMILNQIKILYKTDFQTRIS